MMTDTAHYGRTGQKDKREQPGMTGLYYCFYPANSYRAPGVGSIPQAKSAERTMKVLPGEPLLVRQAAYGLCPPDLVSGPKELFPCQGLCTRGSEHIC